MRTAEAIAEILKREGVEFIVAYPVNQIIEAARGADIRTIIVRQERTGIHMADAYSAPQLGQEGRRLLLQNGPGAENAFGGVAQAYSESVPLVVHPRRLRRATSPTSSPNFNSALNYRTRHQVGGAGHCPQRRAGGACAAPSPRPATAARPGAGRDPRRRLARGGPKSATTSRRTATRYGPDPADVDAAAAGAGRGRAARDLRRPGRALRARPGTSCASWPSCSRRR